MFSVFIACDKEETPTETPIDSKFGENVVLKIGESVAIQGDELVLTFEKLVEDSRCPTGVDCFWEGQAKINLLVNGSETVEVIMRAGKEDLAKDTLNNIVYTLLTVSPYPDVKDELPLPEDRYSIEITVDQL